MPNFPWDQTTSLVQDDMIPRVKDNFFKSNAFYYRQRNRLYRFSGGRSIVVPVFNDQEGGGGTWYAGMDVFDTRVRDPITAAQFYPRNLAIPISISGDQELTVRGDTAIASLIAQKMKIANRTAVHALGGTNGLFNDGSNPKAVGGLEFALKDSLASLAAYGGISRSTTVATWWNHQIDATAYIASTFPGTDLAPLAKMWVLIGRASGKKPTLIVGNWGAYTMYHGALVKNERYMRPQQDTDLAKAGFENVMFRSAPWVVDEFAPYNASTKKEKLYFINEEAMQLAIHTERDIAFSGWRVPHDQDGRVGYIWWRGELINDEMRAHGKMTDIDVSSVS